MKKFTFANVALLLLAAAAACRAQETPQMPEMPKPTKEHEWLKQLAGEWESVSEMYMEPGKPSMISKGSERSRSLGGFWIVSELEGDAMGSPFTGIMTLGYDPAKKKYVGTWVDNMTDYLWHYTGTVDPTGRILTLEAEGPCPMKQGQIMKFRDVIELKDNNHKVLSSSVFDEGKWQKMLTVTSTRKK